MKHIVCFSGGHSSALVAIEVVRRYGPENVVLVNHECKTEHPDVERFETEVADYLGLPITHVDFADSKTKDQFDVCTDAGMFKYAHHSKELICTSIMKTQPFMAWLSDHYQPIYTLFKPRIDCIVYYGFDANETARIQRRSTIMAANGYRTSFPLAFWQRSIYNTVEVGIIPPNIYTIFKHANCIGCLKAGWQHWYCVYVLYPETYEKASAAEDQIGYTIHKDYSLAEKSVMFDKMVLCGIEPTEKIPALTWWAMVKKILADYDGTVVDMELAEEESKPCECLI